MFSAQQMLEEKRPTRLLSDQNLHLMSKTLLTGDVRRAKREELEALAHWLDTKFEIPGLRLRFGIDALLGLLPGVGDTASAVASVYILQAAANFGVVRVTLARMTLNILVDLLLGSIPFVGDIFDVFWKANRKNVELLQRHVEASPNAEKNLRRTDRIFVALLIGVIFLVLAVSISAAYYFLSWLGHLIRR